MAEQEQKRGQRHQRAETHAGLGGAGAAQEGSQRRHALILERYGEALGEEGDEADEADPGEEPAGPGVLAPEAQQAGEDKGEADRQKPGRRPRKNEGERRAGPAERIAGEAASVRQVPGDQRIAEPAGQ